MTYQSDRAAKIAHELTRPLDELRNLHYIRGDVRRMLDLIEWPGPLTFTEYADLRSFELGTTIPNIAAYLGISKQRVSIRLKRADQKLRRHLAAQENTK